MRRRRLRVSLLFASAIVVTAIGATSQPVSAQKPEETTIAFGVPLDELLAGYPDATRLSDGSYQLEPGLRLVPPRQQSDIGITATVCQDGYFCVYEHSDFAGWTFWLGACGRYNLPRMDVVSSMYNDTNSGRAEFWDLDTNPDLYGSLSPNSYWRNMRYNSAPDGGNWNDRVDAIRAFPC